MKVATIRVDSLELHGFHGWHKHEGEFGQRFMIDLELSVDIERAAASDQLGDALNYADVIAATRRLFLDRRYHLLEAAATAVGRGLLAEFAPIRSLVVRVKKLTPPVPEKLAYVGVEVVLSREQMAEALIALGGNLGDVVDSFRYALARFQTPSARLLAHSSVYRTQPWGRRDQPDFFNMAARLEARIEPVELLALCLAIEAERGRARGVRWGPRTLDIDLIAFDDRNMRTRGLELPHPRAVSRAFVMIPLAEIAPDFILADRTIRSWAADCDDAGVRRDESATRALGR